MKLFKNILKGQPEKKLASLMKRLEEIDQQREKNITEYVQEYNQKFPPRDQVIEDCIDIEISYQKQITEINAKIKRLLTHEF